MSLFNNKLQKVQMAMLGQDVQDRFTNNETQLAQKANLSDVQNMSKGSPSGTYATLSALQTAFPTGNTNIYVVTADGGWYYWNGTAWTKGGTYQSTGLADNSVGTSNLKDYTINNQKLSKANMNIYDQTLDVSPNIIDNSYVDSSGNIVSLSSYYISTKISVRGGYNYIIASVPNGQPLIGAWYDTNNIWISTITSGGVVGNLSVTAPTNASFLRLNNQKATKLTSVTDIVGFPSVNTDSLMDSSITTKKIADGSVSTQKIMDYSVTNTKLYDGNANLFDPTMQVSPNIIDGYYLNSSGVQAALSNWFISAPMTAYPNQKITISNYKSDQTLFGGFYDSNGNWIANIGSASVVTPANASTFRVNVYRPNNPYTVICQTGTQAVDNSRIRDGAVTKSKLESTLANSIVSYFNKALSRKQLGVFFQKLMSKQNLNILGFGNSITNFQNSETLALTDQKTAPIGLAGENYLRKLWKLLNYNVYSEDRNTIVNVNGNMGFKRFDHSDWTFSNGYEGNSVALSAKDWGTNRSDASDTWRQRIFNSYAQVITSESSYNKPAVGTIKSGAIATVTVPSNAIGCSLVFLKGNNISTQVQIKINDGTTDIVNETVNLSNILNVYELHRDYNLTAGTTKTITITNQNANELWLWGLEYWTGNFVRVINNGLAGNNASQLNSKADVSVTNYQNIDLVVFEVPALNDAQALTESNAYTNAKALIDKLISYGVPVLMLLTHRNGTTGYAIQYDRTNIIYDATNFPSGTTCVGNIHFYPNYIKMYKSLASYANFANIDMFSKSVSDIGQGLSNTISAPTNYYVDGIHPGSTLVASYEAEFKKLFLWDDVE